MNTKLHKAQILRGYKAFSNVIGRGLTIIDQPIRAFYMENPAEHSMMRVGFATSRQIRSAASRNRMKRLMREAFRSHKTGLATAVEGTGIDLEIVLMYVGGTGRSARRLHLGDIEPNIRRILETISASTRGTAR